MNLIQGQVDQIAGKLSDIVKALGGRDADDALASLLRTCCDGETEVNILIGDAWYTGVITDIEYGLVYFQERNARIAVYRLSTITGFSSYSKDRTY